MEGDGAKGQSMDAAGSSWVPCMQIINCIGGITEIIPVLPGVVLHTIVFPFDQVLQLPAEHVAVEDFFYHILLLAVNKLWRWWRRCVSTSDGVSGHQCQLDHIEHWMEAAHRRG